MLDLWEFLLLRFQGKQGREAVAVESMALTEAAIETERPASTPSFLEATQAFAACLDGGPTDLSVNQQYLEGLGAE